MEEFVRNWGYWAVLLGACVEGETIMLIAAWFAAQGSLNIYLITLIAFIGTLIADQGLFFVGRYHGQKIIARYPQWRPKIEKIFALLERYKKLFILSFRFIYGIRNLSPLVIGASNISTSLFVGLNILASAIWAIVSCFGFYILVKQIDNLSDLLAKYHEATPKIVGGVLCIFAVIVVIAIRYYNNKKEKP